MSESRMIFDGLYDNQETQQRERWKGGKIISFITLGMLLSMKPPHVGSTWWKEWGEYPNVHL